MNHRLVLLLATSLVAGCGKHGSIVVVTVTSSSMFAVSSLTADVTAGGRHQTFAVPLSASTIPPDQTFGIEVPPDVSGVIAVTVTGGGRTGGGNVQINAGGRADLTVTLGNG